MSTSSTEPQRPDRQPMDAAVVQAALARPQYWSVRHVARTRSTNDDLARGSAGGPAAADGTVLVTEEQTAGRGRSGRQWSCPAGAGLMFSVKVPTDRIPAARRAWVGVALGMAVVHAFRAIAGVDASLKWPNDVLVAGGKCGGILAESAGDSVVVGAGLNVSLHRTELPRDDATSLLLAGAAPTDRNRLLAAILDRFGDLLAAWRAADGDVDACGLRPDYLQVCSTVGAQVRLELPGDSWISGTAVDVDPDGAIVVQSRDGSHRRFSAGDVVHLRPGAPAAG